MKLKTTILKKLNTPKNRVALAQLMDCTEATIIKYLRVNDDNLTKYGVLLYISQLLNTEIENLIEHEYHNENRTA